MVNDAADGDTRDDAPGRVDGVAGDATGGDATAAAAPTDAASADDAFSDDPSPSPPVTDSGRDDTGTSGAGARSVAVPTRVYKSVTVFSTLFAVLTVVVGFVLLDAATKRASVSLARADPVLALAGVGLIVLGAVTYAFSTRFRAAEMGNAKDDDDEPSNNG